MRRRNASAARQEEPSGAEIRYLVRIGRQELCMADTPIYEALARAFVVEGVDTHFTLMGDGNMHWVTAMKNMPGMTTIHARHEHAACAMAMGHHGATGKVGVASVTCGPGFSQIMTALTCAAHNHIPLVVLAGEPPMHASWYLQTVDQAALARPTGAHYIAAHSARRMHEHVREAFYVARTQRRPVILGVPYDLQKELLPDIGPYQPAAAIIPDIGHPLPDRGQLDLVAERLMAATCPIIVAGRGVLLAGAEAAAEALAERAGALLATTLPVRGLFDHNPYALGISGGYARPIAREMGAEADFVLMLGASMTYYTVDGGRMFPRAEIAQVDLAPLGFNNGLRAGDIHLRGDVGATLAALLGATAGLQPRASVRTPELARRIRDEPDDGRTFPIEPGLHDPRIAVAALDRVIPKDFFMIEGSGHNSYFPSSSMRGRDPRRFLAFKEFGAIGNATCFSIGVAAEHRDGRVLLIEGDGSFLMHIQELETLRRHGLKVLYVIMNDGAYGAEIHKLRAEGIDDSGAIFGRPDFASIAQGFGLAGATVTDLAQLDDLFAAYSEGDVATVWDVHISDKVVSPRMSAGLQRGHGRM